MNGQRCPKIFKFWPRNQFLSKKYAFLCFFAKCVVVTANLFCLKSGRHETRHVVPLGTWECLRAQPFTLPFTQQLICMQILSCLIVFSNDNGCCVSSRLRNTDRGRRNTLNQWLPRTTTNLTCSSWPRLTPSAGCGQARPSQLQLNGNNHRSDSTCASLQVFPLQCNTQMPVDSLFPFYLPATNFSKCVFTVPIFVDLLLKIVYFPWGELL